MDSFSWNKSHWFIDKVMIQYPVRRVPWFGKTINNNEENPQKAVSSQRKLKIVISQSLNRPIVNEVIPQSLNRPIINQNPIVPFVKPFASFVV